MATYIGTDDNGKLTYQNQPEAKKTLFKNDSELSAEEVTSIVVSTLASLGIVITNDKITINKKLYAFNEVDDSEVARPVMLTTADGTLGAGLIATNKAGTEYQIWVSGRYSEQEGVTTKIFVAK